MVLFSDIYLNKLMLFFSKCPTQGENTCPICIADHGLLVSVHSIKCWQVFKDSLPLGKGFGKWWWGSAGT